MPRQSVTLTTPNDDWLLEQASSGEFQNKSDVINSLIRDARKDCERLDWVRAALIEGEASKTRIIAPEEIRARARKALKANGAL